MTASETLRLRSHTPAAFADAVLANFGTFLADHAVCELQAAVQALSLVGSYPEDALLVDRLSALAAEELRHFRKVSKEAKRQGASLATRRRNGYVAALRNACRAAGEPGRSAELLLVCAVIEARSEERFGVLVPRLEEPRLRRLYEELARAEARHGPAYLDLARRRAPARIVDDVLGRLLGVDAAAIAGPRRGPIAVHAAFPG